MSNEYTTNEKLAAVMAKADQMPHLKKLGKRNSKRAKKRAITLYLAHANTHKPGYVSKDRLE